MSISKKIQKIIKKIFVELLKTTKKDKILIVCDKNTKELAEMFFENSLGLGEHSLLIVTKESEIHGQEPEKNVEFLMKNHNVILLITTKSLSHTLARKKATKKGARILSMPGINIQMLKRCVDVDYKKMEMLHKRIANEMKRIKYVRITTKKGTDIKFKIYNNKIVSKLSFCKKGDFDNLPSGEVFVSPQEGTAEGIFIVDGSISGIGKIKNPIKITVKKGNAVKIEGKEEALCLKKILKKIKNKKAYNIAEFGIGTNPNAKITGNVLEDEKAIGTCHIALGNNYSFGGKVNVPIHIDGIIKNPTIFFDKKIIMKEGKFKI